MPTKTPPSQHNEPPPHHQQQQQQKEEEKEELEDYIDMDLSSKTSSPPQTKEFEFQILSPSPNHKSKDALFPADDLFHNGKLLPLLLPSRRQMLDSDFTKSPFDYHSTPPTNTLNTPLHSCNIKPSESCRVSCELSYTDDDYFLEWSNELTTFVNHRRHLHHHQNNNNNNNNNNHLCRNKRSWPKKLKLANKLRASRAYLKSLFTKSTCSDVVDSSCDSGHNFREIANESSKNASKKKAITIATIMKSSDRDHHGISEDANNSNNVQRRSFSGAIIKRHYSAANHNYKCSSSSSSSGDSWSNELRRSSSSATHEIEAAIAHCKKSCEGLDSRGDGSGEVGGVLCSFSVSRNVNNADQKRPGFCSI